MIRGRSLSLALFAVVMLAACNRKPETGVTAAPGAEAPFRLGMVTDVGGLGDRSFNDSAYAGLLRAKKDLGAQIQVLQSKSAADYQPNLTLLSNVEDAEIFAVGFLMATDVASVAKNNPRRHFAIVDAVVNEPNVTSILFREQDGSFLAGALAALVSKTHAVGFIGGVDSPLLRKFESGFIAGAREVDPQIRTVVKYVGSFDDVASGKELAGLAFDSGADVLYVAAGKSGLGAIDAVRSRSNDYLIGVDSDQDAIVPGKILTSVVKHVDIAVFDVAEEVHSQKIPSGTVEFGLRDGGVSLTDYKFTRAAIGAKNIAIVDALKNEIVAGTLVPPATRSALAAFKPSPLPTP